MVLKIWILGQRIPILCQGSSHLVLLEGLIVVFHYLCRRCSHTCKPISAQIFNFGLSFCFVKYSSHFIIIPPSFSTNSNYWNQHLNNSSQFIYPNGILFITQRIILLFKNLVFRIWSFQSGIRSTRRFLAMRKCTIWMTLNLDLFC